MFTSLRLLSDTLVSSIKGELIILVDVNSSLIL